jgi:hypothetical protein
MCIVVSFLYRLELKPENAPPDPQKGRPGDFVDDFFGDFEKSL